MEPLTAGEARALLAAKDLLDSGELPGPVYDVLAGWVVRKLGVREIPNIIVNPGAEVYPREGWSISG
jgi:hypothetical protein